MNPAELKANIDTIVVLIFENRSFDNVLGHLAHPKYGNRQDVEGITDETHPDWSNPTSQNLGAPPFFTPDFVVNTDLPHGSLAVQTQLAKSTMRGSFDMNGFARAYEEQFHSQMKNPPVMALLDSSAVPITGPLAAQYTVCDHWFACVPSSTAPNRMMSMCGDTPLVETGIFLPETPTVYDWLTDQGVSWRVYSAGLPFFALMLPKMATLVLGPNFRDIDRLAIDLANGDWPQVVFIEPDYFDSPARARPPCDNHAPLSMAPGEDFLKGVYESLSSNTATWAKTAMFVTYDEHGGFWDHVAPLNVSYQNANGLVSFASTGPRVPALALGPFAAQGGVCKAQLDNTSILQLLAERFGAGHYSDAVHQRRAQGIASASAALSVNANNTTVVQLPHVVIPTQPKPGGLPSALGVAFLDAARQLVATNPVATFKQFPWLKGI